MTPIRVVAPFRPFPPESDLHKQMADFDWVDAIGLLQASVERACQCPFHVITDVDTSLPLPTLQYSTTHRRLMLWYLEVSLRYLESDDFDRDTIAMDSDQLVFADLRHIVTPNADLVICARPEHLNRPDAFPILNGVQVWAHRAKSALVEFYRQALSVAEGLPEDRIVWGADTDALRILLAPIAVGLHRRAGLTVHMRDARAVIEPFSNVMKRWVADGRPFWPAKPIVDFRWRRKPSMRPMFEHVLAKAVTT